MLIILFFQAFVFVYLSSVFEKYPLVIIVVTPAKKEVHTAKGTPILVLSPVKDGAVVTVTPVKPTSVSETVRCIFCSKNLSVLFEMSLSILSDFSKSSFSVFYYISLIPPSFVFLTVLGLP